MSEDPTTITAEFQDHDIDVVSKDPLIGRLELIADTDEVIEVTLDRDTATALLSALVEFLAQGEGEDAPNITTSTVQ